MASLNKVVLVGNMTRQAETSTTNSGTMCAKFGIAINRKFRNSNGDLQDDTTFVDIESWGKTAEFVSKYLGKGNSVLVEGRLKLDSWEDRQTGAKRQKLKVVAESVQGLDRRERGTESAPMTNYGNNPQPAPQAPPIPDGSHGNEVDGIPF